MYKYTITHPAKKPGYIQLYDQLKRDIIDGVFSYGAKLPSKRTMAEETDTSVITVEHAYSILADEGYIESRQRSGYFVIYRDRDFMQSGHMEATGHMEASNSLTSSIGGASHTETMSPTGATTPGEFPFSVMARTMRSVLSKYAHGIFVKSPNKGCLELRQEICSYLKRTSDMDVSPEQVVIGAGAEYLYSLVAQLLGKDRIFALESPSYRKIQQVYEANDVRCDLLELGRHGIKSAHLQKTDATVLHITPFNSYPCHITTDVSKRKEYIHWAQSRHGVIVEDNYDSELTVSAKNDETVFSMAKDCSVVYINTFSHTISPSVRVGYMVLSSDLVADFEQKLGFYSCTVPVFEQYVLTELIHSGDFERHINRVRRKRRKTPE